MSRKTDKITVDEARGSCAMDFHFGGTGPGADAVRPCIAQLANRIDQQSGASPDRHPESGRRGRTRQH